MATLKQRFSRVFSAALILSTLAAASLGLVGASPAVTTHVSPSHLIACESLPPCD